MNLDGQILLIVDENAIALDEDLSNFTPSQTLTSLGHYQHSALQSLAPELISPYLIIQSAHEFFALRLDDVLEVVTLKSMEDITSIPHAPPEIYGFYLLRGHALLSFSMNAIFGITPHVEIFGVVVKTTAGRMMLCAEKIHGIQRFDDDSIQDPIGESSEFLGWMRGQHDEMIGIIDIDALFSADNLLKYETFMIESEDSQNIHVVEESQQFLAFWIGQEKCCLPIECVYQITEKHLKTDLPQAVPGQEISEAAQLMCGVTQIQGNVMPIIDLYPYFHNGVTHHEMETTHTIIAYVDNKMFAILVDTIDRVINVPVQNIDYSVLNHNPFVSGIAQLSGSLLTIVSLDPLQRLEAKPVKAD